MALVKPMVNEIVAFDAEHEATISFIANGGDQVVKNEIKVVYNEYVQGYYNPIDYLFYKESTFETPVNGEVGVIYIDMNTNKNYLYDTDNSIFVLTTLTEVIAYQDEVISYNLNHVIPADTLTNGRYYKVAIRTYDAVGNISDWSNYQPFYCYTTPTLLLNVISGQTLSESSYTFRLEYNQIEGEKVDYALIQLYNANSILIGTSGNLYNTDYPPMEFSYPVYGLTNHSQYYVKATVITINGTIVQTSMIRFYVNYDVIYDAATLTATVDSCNGYVNLHSSLIANVLGESNPDPLTYIDNEMADLRSAVGDITNIHSYWAKWGNDTFIIPKNFILRLWFYPARQPFDIIRLSNDSNTTYLSISLKRSTTQDYLSIRTDNGTTIDTPLNMFCNGNTKIFLWVKVVDNNWTVQHNILESAITVLNWNDSNDNIPLNTTSDVHYVNETYETFTPSANNYQPMSDILTNIVVGNGVIDHMNIMGDTTIPYSEVKPDWGVGTLLNVTFNGNIVATPHYTKIVLKRKDESVLNWINMSEIIVRDNVPNYIDFNDSFIPTGIQQEYALVVYINDIPSEYYTVDVTPQWGKYFLSDKNNRFILNYAVIYSNHVQNIQNGMFMPIGATYPIIVQNGEGNYRSGSLQFKVLGYQFEIDKRLDRVSITNQLDDILKFLTNGKAKCLTDFNGNIFIIKVINSPQISFDANWGNGIATVSFDWVEQGKYNDYDSMLELGLFDYIASDE